MPILHKKFTYTKNINNQALKILALVVLCAQGSCRLSAMAPGGEQSQNPATQNISTQDTNHPGNSTQDNGSQDTTTPQETNATTQEQAQEQLQYSESGEKFFRMNAVMALFAESIARNPQNSTDSEILNESAHNILHFSEITEQYHADLDYLLRGYTANEHDNASRGVKVIRYILTQRMPEERKQFLSLRSFQNAQDLITLLNQIEDLSNEQIEQGHLLDNLDTPSHLGQLFNDICTRDIASIPVKALFKKIETAFVDNLQGLQQLLSHQNNFGETALMRAARSNTNPAVITALITSLQQAFVNNTQELQQALNHQNNFGETALIKAARLNTNPVVITALITSLQQAFINNSQGLLQALNHQNNDGNTALMRAAMINTSPAVITALITSLQQAFINNSQGLIQALNHQNNDGYTALMWAARSNINPVVITALITSLQQAFINNPQGLLQVLNHQNNDGETALIIATQRNNQAITVLETAIAQAEVTLAQQQVT